MWRDCVNCGNYCQVCDDDTLACSQCKDSFTITPQKTCICSSQVIVQATQSCMACADPNCFSCNQQLVCTVCKEGYTLTGESCLAPYNNLDFQVAQQFKESDQPHSDLQFEISLLKDKKEITDLSFLSALAPGLKILQISPPEYLLKQDFELSTPDAKNPTQKILCYVDIKQDI